MMEVCVIVDPYKFSQDFAKYCHQKGYVCIHVQSTSQPIADMQASTTWRKQDYIENLIFDGNIPHLVAQLEKHSIKCVIAGSEPGVELADILAVHFNTPNNGLSKSHARRDKFLMNEALIKAQVPCVKHFKSNDFHAVLNWVETNTSWPVVIKPLRSAATNDVYFCHSAEKLLHYFNKICNKKNIFGEINAEVLVQSFLDGTEYIVDTVSCDHKHFVACIWQYKKRYVKELDTIIYDRVMLLPSDGALQTQLINYVIKILETLEIQYGAGHAEIMMTDKGPILVEIGARIGGHLNMAACDACLGYNLVELTVDAYVDPIAFQEKTKLTYQLKNHCSVIYLVSSQEGIVEALPILDSIKKLQSLFIINMDVEAGKKLVKTHDMLTAAGKIILKNENSDLIEADYQTLMLAEPDGYVIKKSQ